MQVQFRLEQEQPSIALEDLQQWPVKAAMKYWSWVSNSILASCNIIKDISHT